VDAARAEPIVKRWGGLRLHLSANVRFTLDVLSPRILAVAGLLFFPAIGMMSPDNRAPSTQPPGDLAIADVPMFVMIGFDDNPDVEPMTWILDYLAEKTNPIGSGQVAAFDGSPTRVAFYSNGKYLENSAPLRALHLRAFREGHEIGNHTHNHFHGGEFTTETWTEEMRLCRDALVGCGIPNDSMIGFRTPFLEYNDHTLAAARQMGLIYDTSLEEGVRPDEDGTNFVWPFTLDNGGPGNAYYHAPGAAKHITSHPGFWEIPLHVFMVPPDDVAAEYEIAPGLAERIYQTIKTTQGWEWSAESRKITGLDWNVLEGAGRTAPEFLAILKHTLELRLAGNRAPLMVGARTALFATDKPDRRVAMEAFIGYALSHPEVRIVIPSQLITWLRDPQPLGN